MSVFNPKDYIGTKVTYVSPTTKGETIIKIKNVQPIGGSDIFAVESMNGNKYRSNNIVFGAKNKTTFLDVEQINVLKEKQWSVKPDGFFITLYADDFREDTWEAYCNEIGCESYLSEITILLFGYKQ